MIQSGQVDEHGNADYTFEGIKGSPQEFAYRNKMEFSFGDEYKDGPLSLGLHKKGSTYDVLNACDCKLVHEDMTKILTCVLEYCRDQGIAMLPGALTPSDVSACLRYGFSTIKLFPAGDMPKGYIKSLKGPLDGTEYVAIGGVNPGNIGDFFRQGYLAWAWEAA